MSKAVLIIDMPEKCKECRFKDTNYHLEDICLCKTEKDKDGGEYFKEIVDIKTKPDWCPLRELPEKIGTEEELKMPRDGCISDVINSYNACIDELLGEEHGK